MYVVMWNNALRALFHITTYILRATTALGIIAIIAITAWGWLTLPAVIPTHYGISGVPNAYGGKGSLLILPIVSICLYILLTVLVRFPHIYNYPWPITDENAPRQYYLARLLLRWLTLEIVWTFCAIQWVIIQAARSYSASLILLFTLVIPLILIITIILYMRAAAHAR